jgi:hypothetical protein
MLACPLLLCKIAVVGSTDINRLIAIILHNNNK